MVSVPVITVAPFQWRHNARCTTSGWLVGSSRWATASGSLDTGELSLISTRGPSGAPFKVAQLYMRMAEGIREGTSVSPDFDVAVKRHQLLDVIQKASDTGIRQIL
jgi:hypothetical protein